MSKPPPIELMRLEDTTPEAARVLIAKDALQLLAAEFIEPHAGSYVENDVDYMHEKDETPAHEVIDRMSGCQVCALGAALVAGIRRFNDAPIGDFLFRPTYGSDNRVSTIQRHFLSPDRKVVVGYLQRFFSREQLDLMEYVFEGQSFAYNLEYGDDQENAIVEYRDQIISGVDDYIEGWKDIRDTLLLRAIFQNIIDNNGTFVVPGFTP